MTTMPAQCSQPPPMLHGIKHFYLHERLSRPQKSLDFSPVLKGPCGAGLVQHQIDRDCARSIHAVMPQVLGRAILRSLSVIGWSQATAKLFLRQCYATDGGSSVVQVYNFVKCEFSVVAVNG